MYCNIQDTSPSVVVSLASSEFQRICRDLSQFGDSMSIACTKEGITFSTVGATEGSAKITLKPTMSMDEKKGESVSLGHIVYLRNAFTIVPVVFNR